MVKKTKLQTTFKFIKNKQTKCTKNNNVVSTETECTSSEAETVGQNKEKGLHCKANG